MNKTISQGFIISGSRGCLWMIIKGSNMVYEGVLVVQKGSILFHEGA